MLGQNSSPSYPFCLMMKMSTTDTQILYQKYITSANECGTVQAAKDSANAYFALIIVDESATKTSTILLTLN